MERGMGQWLYQTELGGGTSLVFWGWGGEKRFVLKWG